MRVSAGKKISLRLDYDLAERLEDYAARERVPVSFVLRHLVIRFLERPVPTPDLSPPGGAALTGHREGFRHGSPDPERVQAEFTQEVCSLFDRFIAAGYDVKEATKRTNFALKAKKHPWATFDVVSKALRDTGRFRKRRTENARTVQR